MAFEGSCHCGAVVFRVDQDAPKTAISCNCSHCGRKGFLLSFVPASAVTILQGEGALTDYYFNRHAITHRFCAVCGCQPFGRGKGQDGAEIVSVNLRCVPSIDIGSLTVRQVDGASF